MIIDSPIVSGSYAGTGSLNQVGNVVISGSLTVSGSIIGDVTGSATSSSYASTAVSASFATTASYAANVPLTASYANNATSASYAVSASNALNALTASYLSNYIPPFPFTGSAGISGSLTVNGPITAQTLVVQTITSSVDFVTGSTRFGVTSSNTHRFTGSVSVTGSLTLNGSSVVRSNQTSSMYVYSSNVSDYATSAGSVTSASYANTTTSASYANTATSASYALSTPLYNNSTAQISASTQILSSTTTLYSLSGFKGAVMDYVVSASGSNDSMRAGTLTAAWNGTSSTYNESTTMDIGDTSAVEFSVDSTGSILITVDSGSWEVNSLYRGLGVVFTAPPEQITVYNDSISTSACIGYFPVNVWIPGGTVVDNGVILYTDDTLTTPYTGNWYVAYNAYNYAVDQVTGELSNKTSCGNYYIVTRYFCMGTGTCQIDAPNFTLVSDQVLTVGKYYYDGAFAYEVTATSSPVPTPYIAFYGGPFTEYASCPCP